MTTTLLEYRDGSSHKFWEITVKGAQHTVRFGKVGTQGQSKQKSFDSVEAARTDADALIRSKTRKGYAPVGKKAARGNAAPRARKADAPQSLKAQRRIIDTASGTPFIRGKGAQKEALDQCDGLFALRPPPRRSDPHYADWLSAMNNVIATAFGLGQYERAAGWAAVAKAHARRHHNLAHNLACAFAGAKQYDEAFEMCVAAVEIGYTDLWRLREDTDLGSLLKEERFSALFEDADAKVAKPTPPPSWGYYVSDDKKKLQAHRVPAILDRLGYWLRYQPHGSVGVELFEYGRIGKEHGLSAQQREQGFVFFRLGEGSDICLFDVGNTQPVVLLGGEGDRRLLAPSVEDFLLDWSERRTGLTELDEDAGSASRRANFKSWLAYQGVQRPKKRAKIDLKQFLEGALLS